MTDFEEVKHRGTSCLEFKFVKDFGNFKTKLKGLCESRRGLGISQTCLCGLFLV